MLGYLRNNSGSFVNNFIIVVLSLAFIFFFGSGALNSARTEVVAEVNGTAIRDVELDLLVRRRMRATSSQGTQADRERIQQRVLDGMIDRELLLQAAAAEGFLVTSLELKRAVLEDRRFQDDDGKFDMEGYRDWVGKNKKGIRELQEGHRERLMMVKVQNFIRRSVQITPGEVKAAYIQESASRNVEFVRVTTNAFKSDIAITDEELDAWADENAAEVRERYDRDFELKYHESERVRARHILLKFDDADGEDVRSDLTERIQAILTEVRAEGADFEALAQKYSEDGSATSGGDLGFFDETAMVKPFSEAAFAMQPGDISDVVESAFGYHIIKVEEREDATVKKLEDVRLQVAGDLMREEQAPALARDFAGKLVLALNGTMGEAERDELLESRSLSLAESGVFSRRDRRVPKVGAAPEVVQAAFALASVGDTIPEPLELRSGWVVMRLKEKTEADMAAFEEKKDQLRSRLLRQKQATALQDWKSDLHTQGKVLVRKGV
jgi:peptidyl-prolyl cis-trans isomerase D